MVPLILIHSVALASTNSWCRYLLQCTHDVWRHSFSAKVKMESGKIWKKAVCDHDIQLASMVESSEISVYKDALHNLI